MNDPIAGGVYSIATVNAMGNTLVFAVVKPSPWPKGGLAIRMSNRVIGSTHEVRLRRHMFSASQGAVAIVNVALPEVFRGRKLWWSVESPLPFTPAGQ